jgi:hypothetical protein
MVTDSIHFGSYSLHTSRCIKNLSTSLPYFHLINVCVRNIYPSLNVYIKDIYFSLMISEQNDSSTLHLRKMTRLIGYKYPMNPLSSRFTIYILYCIYIFRVSLSKISLYSFSIKIFT